jgi:hypothetical protein
VHRRAKNDGVDKAKHQHGVSVRMLILAFSASFFFFFFSVE